MKRCVVRGCGRRARGKSRLAGLLCDKHLQRVIRESAMRRHAVGSRVYQLPQDWLRDLKERVNG